MEDQDVHSDDPVTRRPDNQGEGAEFGSVGRERSDFAHARLGSGDSRQMDLDESSEQRRVRDRERIVLQFSSDSGEREAFDSAGIEHWRRAERTDEEDRGGVDCGERHYPKFFILINYLF